MRDPLSRSFSAERPSSEQLYVDIAHVGYSFSNAEGSLDAAGAVRGFSFNIGLDYGGLATGSTYTSRGASASIAGYLSMPWPGHQTLAVRTAGAVSAGNYPRGGSYSVGGYDLDNNSLPSTLLSGAFNGSFALRGYPPRAYAGANYFLQNVEYRIPLFKPDRGLSTLPVYLRRIDGNLFWDYGGAFDYLRFPQPPALPVRRRSSSPGSSTPRSAARSGSRRHARLPAQRPVPPRLRLRLQRRGHPGWAAVLHRLQRLLTENLPRHARLR